MQIIPLHPKALALFVLLVGLSLFRVPTYTHVSGYDIITEHPYSGERFTAQPIWDMNNTGHIDVARLLITWAFCYLVALVISRLFQMKERTR